VIVEVISHRDPEPLDPAAFEHLALFVLRHEQVPDVAELSVLLTDEEEMASLNTKWRGKEGPTDVLSFGCDDVCTASEDEPITLGDIVIAPTIAEAQAAELGTTVEAELNLLLVHGILHLLGYDHEADEDAEAMQARETVLLTAYAEVG
jgi:probable rRNA maturation factor